MTRRAIALGVIALIATCVSSAPALAADPFGPLAAPAFQTSYSDEVLADSPISYWRLGEATGSTMTDVTAANNGSYTGGITLGQPGALPFDPNTAVTFNGTTGRASAPDSNSLDRTGAVTVELWVKRTKSAAYQVLVGKPGHGQSRFENYAIWFNTTNRAQAYFGNGTTFVSPVSAVIDTNWHHIAATYDNAVARIYVDGVQSGSASSTVALTPNQFPMNVARANANQYYLGGTLDEIAVYPTALSAARIQVHYAKAAADVTAPTITLTQPANGATTSDTTPSLAGTAGTAVGDSSTVTVRVYQGAGTSGALLQSPTTTAGAGGAYAVDSPALAEGTYTARAEQTDTGGNTGFSGAATFTIDTTAPTASITGGPADPTNSTSASLAFSSEPGAGFQCKLDAGSYSSCTSPKDYTGLGEGNHTFSVTATDSAGNTGPAATRSWTIDTTAPTASITGGPADPTNSTSASLAFSSEPGAGFQCKLDAGSYSSCTSPKDYTGLGEGNHTFSVTATDSAGNTGPAATRSWTIDTTAPTASITGGPADPTNSTSASLAFSSEPGAGFECKLDAGSYSSCTSPKDYTGLGEGNHTFSVTATDSAGNTGPAATRSWTIDTTAPTVTLTSPANGSTTSDPSPSLAGVAGTAVGDGTAITVRLYSGAAATGSPIQTLGATRGAGGAYAVAPTALAAGTYTAQSQQDDAAGNAALSAPTTFTIDPLAGDTTPPAISLLAPADGSVTSNQTPGFVGVAGVAAGDSTTVTVRVYAGPTVLDPLVRTLTTTRDVDGSFAVAASPALADGTYTARAEQTDTGGNTGFSGAAAFTIDTTAPSVTITSGPADPTNSTSASLAFSSEPGAGFECKLDAGSYAACTSPKDYTGLGEGNHTFDVRATDTAGNTGSPATRSWTIDTTAPSVTITTGPSDPSTSADASLEFTSEPGAAFECKRDAGSYSSCISPKAYTGLSDGSHTFSVRAGDQAGNTGSPATRTWTIDTVGPTTSITSGPTDPTNSTSASIAFSSEPGAAFQCKIDTGNYDPCTSPKNYSGLGQGNRTVSVRATDTAGNTGSPATHSWTIDLTNPIVTITSPPDGSSTTDTTPNLAGVAGTAIGDSATVTVSVYAGAVATGSPVQTLAATRGAGGAYNIDTGALANGTYTARASQVDSAGNTGQSGTTTFTVDTVAPVITLTSPANGSSPTTATPTFSGVAGTAAGDSTSVTVRIYTGSNTSGVPLQTLTATRGAGGAYSVNSATLSQGTYTARAEQIDAAGNNGLSSANTFSIADPVLIGAGDIAGCESGDGDAETAALLAQNPNATVFTLGDNAYPNGQPSEYTNCYGPTWGAHKARTRPITGGHDTATVNGGSLPNQGFVDYFSAQLAPFGPTATDRLKTYYSYNIGAWHVVALNSACYFDLPGCNTAQMEQWFRDDLAANSNVCTAVTWHDARWSSGNIHGNQVFTQPLWEIAYDGGADIVLSGNEHDYERFAPQDANGALDNTFGVRAFVVGTGGYYLYDLDALEPNSQAYSSTYGVMKLTLHPTSYDWQFIPVAGGTFTDSGTDNCHGAPAPPAGTPTVRSKASSSAPYPSTSLAISKPAGTLAGDLLLATISHQGGSQRNITPPAGWTNIPSADVSQGSNARIHAWYKVAGASEPASYTFTLTGGGGMSIAGGVMAIQGADSANPINAAGGQSTGSTNVTQLTAPSITTTKPNTALIYSGAVNTPATFTPPQLMPEQWDVIGAGSYQIATEAAVGGVAVAGATGTRAATLSTSAAGVAIAIAVAGP